MKVTILAVMFIASGLGIYIVGVASYLARHEPFDVFDELFGDVPRTPPTIDDQKRSTYVPKYPPAD